MPELDHRTVVKQEVFEQETFVGLVLSKPLRGKPNPYVRIAIRPVRVRGSRHLQFSYFDGERDVSKNYSETEAESPLDEALALPFGQLHVSSTAGDLQVLVGRKGNVHIARGAPSHDATGPVLSHNREKRHPLPARGSDPLLKALGIIAKRGNKVRSAMRGKFAQINQFLRIVDQVLPGERRPVRIIDGGCGSAYLTFAAFHYLNHLREIPARVTGVDTKADLIAKCVQLRDSLGWDSLEFHVSAIAAFEPDNLPDVVLSLHACDTATDEAIAQAVRWGSRVVLAAPCCQHELHNQLDAPPLRPLLRHGILRERLADLVTDSFRALVLRIMGYRTSVFEFVSPEMTSKNLMIRAERGLKPGNAAFVREYNGLKAFWGVTPAIEALLGDPFRQLVTAAPGAGL